MLLRPGLVMTGVVVVVMVMMVVVVEGQDLHEVERCQSQSTCAQCIQIPGCVWCSNPKPLQGGDKGSSGQACYHCHHHTADPTTYCNDDVENPSNSHSITIDHPFTEINRQGNRRVDDRIIQMRPQRMKLKLRKGVSESIDVTYRLATDYPVDLYYLMDLSNSMKDDKENIARLGASLAHLLSNLTSQYQLGFGSFVDKVLMPYADTSPTKIERPCAGCARPYSFRNDLRLDTDPALFTQRVSAASISGNMDAPEGGFDALMQAMVCTDQIGWRKTARKILIFSTDAKFHQAGDGRLAGVIIPNDMTCHLNDAGEYTDYDKYDYPSIAQVNKISKENNINIIFAISNPNHEEVYQRLSAVVETSSYGRMESDSKNVVDLVKDQYDRLSSVVRLSDNSSDDDGVNIQYFSRCKGDGPSIPTKECRGVKTDDAIQFRLEVTVTECPTDNSETRYVEVKTLQDSLILEIEVQCTCGCDDPAINEENSPTCSGAGKLVCGVCECNDGFRGKKCECSNQHSESSEQDLTLCRAPNSTRECSGLGRCSCGVCDCYDRQFIHGKYCNCNRRRCLSGDGNECSGHGLCGCNKCDCNPGYTGDLCECPDNSHCFDSESMKECSGHGTCECGKCRCQPVQGVTYSGKYCEDCSNCGTGRCLVFRDCVQCLAFESGPMADTCDFCNITINEIDRLDGQISSGASHCIFEDEEGCYFNFTYRYHPDHDNTAVPYIIHVQRERQCPPPPPILAIAFGLVAGIVLIGLLTLALWKIFTTIHDRREYARFEKERAGAAWSREDNPLYKGAQTTFQNPAFGEQVK